MQLLEGQESVVRALYYDRIAADPRHRRCRLLGAGAGAARSFANWDMGFRLTDAGALRALLDAAESHALVLFAPQPRVRPELLQLLLDFVATHELEPFSYL